MANLVQIAEELEYMPKDQLAQMTQDPNSTYPQFLVLSEIQRRTQLERAYQAQAEGMGPQTTVAEETVAEFMGPQGLQGMAEQPMPQDMQPPMQQPMAESPMQMAANGGRTGFMQGGISTRGSLLNTMGIEHTGMTEQEMGNLIGGINREEEQAPRSFGLMDREIVPEISEPETDMMADGGRTGFSDMGSTNSARLQLLASLGIDPTGMSEEEITQQLQQMEGASNKGGLLDFITPKYIGSPYGDVYSPFPSGEGVSELGITQEQINTGVDETESMVRKGLRQRYMDDDGTVDWSQTISDASMLYPGTLALKGIGKGIGWAAPKVSSALQKAWKNRNKLWTKKNPNLKTKKDGTPDLRVKNNPERVVDPKRVGGLSLIGWAAAQTNQKLEEMREANLSKEEAAAIQAEIDKRKAAAAAAAGDANKNNEGTQIETTKKSGPFSNITADQGLTIAQLGGVLMGAKNMSELGTGIAGVAGQAQDRRSSAGLAGAQQAYYEGQVRKIDDEIANMEPKQLASMIDTYQKLIKNERESESDQALITEYKARIDAASKRWSELMGIPFLTQAERDAERAKQLGLNVTDK